MRLTEQHKLSVKESEGGLTNICLTDGKRNWVFLKSQSSITEANKLIERIKQSGAVNLKSFWLEIDPSFL